MERVRSADGTAIAFARTGQGPPLVLVHGTTADHRRWGPILPPLEERFTVCAMDRRGRGASGDAAEYTVSREFEDVAAVLQAAGADVFLFGHSYGAICALEAARLAGNVAKLVLYEPPIPAGVPIRPPGSVERLEALLAQDRRDAVVETFFREVVRTTPEDLAVLKALPSWADRVAAAHTVVREMKVEDTYEFRADRFAAFRIPTLLLLGGASPPFLKRATEMAHAALPTSWIEILPGQAHAAMNTAPELLLGKVLPFLTPGGE